QERDTDRVVARSGKLRGDDVAHERVGDLREDARAVARVGLCAHRAAVVEVQEGRETRVDDVASGCAAQSRDERDSTGVVLESWVVQAWPAGITTLSRRGHDSVLAPPGTPGELLQGDRDALGPTLKDTERERPGPTPTCPPLQQCR